MAAVHHIGAALDADWAQDKQVVAWLDDFADGTQDAIPVFAAQALGPEHVVELAKAAEDAEDWWLASLRWSASALSERRLGWSHARPLFEASAKALQRQGLFQCTMTEKQQLEVSVLLALLSDFSSNEVWYARLDTLMEANPDVVSKDQLLARLQFTEHFPNLVGGNLEVSAPAGLKMLRTCLSELDTVHDSDHTRRCQLYEFANIVATWEAENFAVPGFKWEEIFGDGGCLLTSIASIYDYDSMHATMKAVPWCGFDYALCYPGYVSAVVLHWGDLEAAHASANNMLPAIHKCLEDCSPADFFELAVMKTSWVFWLAFMDRRDEARAILHAGPFDDFNAFMGFILESAGPGVFVPMDPHNVAWDAAGSEFWSQDDSFYFMTCMDMLLAEEPPDPSVVATLPSPQELGLLGVTLSWGSFMAQNDWVTLIPAMLVHERVGSVEGALACVSVMLQADRTKGGVVSKVQHSLAYACRGRVLAAKGESAAAEVAFISAIEAGDAHGHYFLSALALRDLCECVLDKTGREVEGRQRLERHVSRWLKCSVGDLQRYRLPWGAALPLVDESLGQASQSQTPQTPLRQELTPLKMSALKRRARADGVDDALMDVVDDSDDPKETIIDLILSNQPKEEELRLAKLHAELLLMKPSALKRRARADGVAEEALEEADDADDPKGAVIELILAEGVVAG